MQVSRAGDLPELPELSELPENQKNGASPKTHVVAVVVLASGSDRTAGKCLFGLAPAQNKKKKENANLKDKGGVGESPPAREMLERRKRNGEIERNANRRKIRNPIQEELILEVEVPADGNCIYHAFSMQVNGNPSCLELRQIVAETHT